MDKHLKTLEFDKVLEELAKFTDFELTKNKIFKLRPTSDINKLHKQFLMSDEMKNVLRLNLSLPLNKLYDIFQPINDLKYKRTLSIESLIHLACELKTSRLVKSFFAKYQKDFENLFCFTSNLFSDKELEDEIFNTFDDKMNVVDEASMELKNLRNQKRSFEQNIKDTISSLLTNPNFNKYLQNDIVTTRDGRSAFLVKAENKNKIDGIILDASSSLQTYYIEPKELVTLNNKLRNIEIEINKEIEKILFSLSQKIEPFTLEIERNSNILVELDFIYAKAKYSHKFDLCTPQFVKEKIINLKEMKNPILQLVCENIVKNDFYMDENSNAIIITGSNTGGKTVVLKTIGLAVLMAESGLDVGATSAKIYLFDKVLCDIGDEQNILQNLSTFSAHLKNINNIINETTENSLILFDEICSGTDPVEGEALAQAILSFIQKMKAFSISTTHFSSLKNLAFINKNFLNASVAFDNETLKPTYKLLLGIPGLSHAINIASNLGLDKAIIDEASEIINKKQNGQNANSNINNEIIGKIINTHNEIEKHNKELEKKELDVKKIEKEYIEKLETLKNEKRKNLTKFKKKYQNKYEKTRSELKDIIENAKKANDKKVFVTSYNKIANLEKSSFTMFEEDENELSNDYKKIDWNSIKPNDKVLLKNLNQPAVFLNHVKKGKTVQILLGNIKTVVEINKLAKFENSYISKNIKLKKFKKQKPFEFERNNLPSKVDLRGMNVDEAIRTVEYYVDKAILANMTNLTIIAGKGTGALKQAVGDYVKNSNYITKYRTGTMEEGGDCVFFLEV